MLWLGDEACHDTTAVGGKAANLSRLAGGHRVPPGFAVPAQALAGTGVAQPLPAALSDEVRASYAALGERTGEADPPVAVRSSALAEDGSAASFAGQHDTYLNVIGADAVVQAVARCRDSAHSESALDYRRQSGVGADDLSIAVLVQQLVIADVSAVAFSVHPVTGDRDQVLINASWGLGESIVAGTVTPDSFAVGRSDLTLIASAIGAKERMTVAVPGGTEEVAVPEDLRGRSALDEAQVMETARLAITLEAAMGWPVDVECAWRDGLLYLLQCRPITTLPGG